MSRRSFAIFFLFIYTLVLFKPLFPLVDYLLNKDFISKNLCENRNKPKMKCNGKCHLMKQLKKASADIPSEGNTTKGNSNQEESSLHIVSLFAFNTDVPALVLPDNFYLNTVRNSLPSNYLEDIFHPPKA